MQKLVNTALPPQKPGRHAAALGLLSLVAVACFVLGGCTRQWFRNRADEEVAGVLGEKAVDPAWELRGYYVYPHPLARFADPTDPDYPPMPPDDPAAWFLNPKPQWPKEVAHVEGDGYLAVLAWWDEENRRRLKKSGWESKPIEPRFKPGQAPELPPPHAVDDRPTRSQPYLISFEQAVELAFFNSREFQTRRENVYLVALPVTLQRFAFAPQFEATVEGMREWAGSLSSVGKRNRWAADTVLGVSKLFSTGGLLLMQVANETVINLTGAGPRTFSQSTAFLDLIQPLLRGGGRAVTLEPLTQAERNLLYELRDFARFHKEFFLSLAAGDQVTIGGVAGFGGLSLSIQGQARPVGYYPTLLRQAQVLHQEQFVAESYRELQRFQKLATGPSGVSELQVGRVEQSYRTAQTNLLQRRVTESDFLDQFKIQLGLAPDVPLQLDPSPIQPLRQQISRLNEVINGYSDLVNRVRTLETDPEAGGKLRRMIEEVFTQSPVVRETAFGRRIEERWREWRTLLDGADQPSALVGDLGTMLAMLPAVSGVSAPALSQVARLPTYLVLLEALRTRRLVLTRELDRYELRGESPPPELAPELTEVELRYNLGILELRLREFEDFARRQDEGTFGPAQLAGLTGQLMTGMPNPLGMAAGIWPLAPVDRSLARIRRADRFRPIVLYYALILAEARNERLAELEKSWPPLPPVSLQGINLLSANEQDAHRLASRVALESRLDLMNRRAELADAWRDVAVFANSLLGTFDVRYHMEIQTPGAPAKPLDFEGSRSRQQLIFNTELPLVRKLERNNYRASLIAYQRARRNLMAEEDQVVFQIRQTLRQLRRLQEEYQIRQRSLVLAYLQVNQSRETLAADPDPQRDAATTAATLTEQLLNALQSVPREQDGLFSTWIEYTTTRMVLYRDLELMRIDGRGVWIDEFASPESAGPARSREGDAAP